MRVRYAKRSEDGPDRLNLLGLWCPLGEWVEASEAQARKASFLVGTFELEKPEVASPPIEPEQAVLDPKKPEQAVLDPKKPEQGVLIKQKPMTPHLHAFRRGPGRTRKA
jgi:hypothetical protein